MAKKPTNKGLSEPDVEYRHDEGLTEAEWDAWGERNKDALQASFDKAREDYARGHYYTLDEVMAHIRARAKRRQARKA
ncbi:MAG: hypothetical protein WDM89_01975 [Rhizomicrobium sp.]